MRVITPVRVEVTEEEYERRCVTARQGDNGIRVLRVMLTAGGRAVELPDGVTGVMYCRKADGQVVELTGAVNRVYIDFELTEQTLAVPGEVTCEVQVLEGLKVITSGRFSMMAEERVVSEETITSSSEFNALGRALEETRTATKEAAEATEQAVTAAELAAAAAGTADAAANAANTAKENADAAAQAANTAAGAADKARAATETATRAADTARENADAAAQAANTAAETCAAAAKQAEASAEKADASATGADEAAELARQEAAAAKKAKEDADTAAGAADTARTATEAATRSANTAKENADTAAQAANTAAETCAAATAAAERATQTATSVADRTEQALVDLEGATVARYGVRFDGGANSGETVHRLYNAVGLVANVGTDTETAVNDFDNIYPWSERRRCCGYFDETGEFVVNAYQGEPGYAADGSAGEVWVETPIFWYLHEYGEDGSETIVISGYPVPGYKPSPIHVNRDGTLRRKAYTAAYLIGETAERKATSRSGTKAVQKDFPKLMESARNLGPRYALTTAAEVYTRCLLVWVEFATRYVSSVMTGCYGFKQTYGKAQIEEEATNRIVVPTNEASGLLVGMFIRMITHWSAGGIRACITKIEPYDETNTAVYFDGPPVHITTNLSLAAQPWQTGACDGVLASSGSPVSNTDGRYPCVYRGEENPWGNAQTWLSDVRFIREGEGSEENPYRMAVYYLPDITRYQGTYPIEDCAKLNYTIPTDTNGNLRSGWIKRRGYDARYPHVRLPVELGASRTTWYGDCAESRTTAAEEKVPVAVGSYYLTINGGIFSIGYRKDPCSAQMQARLSYDQAGGKGEEVQA